MESKHLKNSFISFIRDMNLLIYSGEKIGVELIKNKINDEVIVNYIFEKYSESDIKGLLILTDKSVKDAGEISKMNKLFWDELSSISAGGKFLYNEGLSLLVEVGLCIIYDVFLFDK